jgi:hypothetical protein
MKTLFVSIVLVLAFVGVVMAQDLPQGDRRNPGFLKYMEATKGLNPDIPDFNRMQPGKKYRLPFGESDTLQDGDTNGIWGREFEKWYGFPYSQLSEKKNVVEASNTPQFKESPPTDERQKAAGFPWRMFVAWLGVGAFLGVISYFVWKTKRDELAREARDKRSTEQQERERELKRDPVTSGTPYVPGGIPQDQPERLANFFSQQAISRYIERNPSLDRNMVQVEQVGPIEIGTIAGEGEVGYLGGIWRPRRISPPIDAYQGRFRFPDGTEELLQSIVRCMNPVRTGGEVMRGFTFTARSVVVPAPQPPAPAPHPVPLPQIAAARIRAGAEEDGRSTISIGDGVMTFEHGFHITVDPVTKRIQKITSAGGFELPLSSTATRPTRKGKTPVRAIGASSGQH